MGINVTCRQLSWFDTWFCYRLARDPMVREMSHDPKPSTRFGHLLWMGRWRTCPDRRAWVIIVRGADRWRCAGLLRAQRREGGGSEIDIAIAPEYRRVGIATSQLLSMTPLIWGVFDGPVYATIKQANGPGFSTFEAAGYKKLTFNAGVFIYVWDADFSFRWE